MKYPYLLLSILFISLLQCKESERGQYPIDNIPPGEVQIQNIENIPGGANITFIIPDDDDLLYIKAFYTLDNGQKMEQKVSSYSNTIKIEGLSKSGETMVSLVTGDRSRNESNPVSVKIYPLDSPIHSILESLVIMDDFGGISFNWENPENAEVMIGILTLDEEDKLINAKNIYTKAKEGQSSLRGFEPEERVFAFYVRDKWNNFSDTISDVFHPMFEEELKGTMKRWNPIGIPYMAYGSYHIEKLWDGGTAAANSFIIVPTERPVNFTLDLGQKIKMSRFKLIQRADIMYTYYGAEIFQLWGSDHPDVSDSFDGWIKLGDFVAKKPSGLPYGQNSPDDIALAVEGEDHMVDLAASPVRYLRFVIFRTWENGMNFSAGELRVFGQIIN